MQKRGETYLFEGPLFQILFTVTQLNHAISTDNFVNGYLDVLCLIGAHKNADDEG